MIDTPITADLVRGFVELETTARGLKPHRLPAWVREQFPDGQLLTVEAQPSGVRVAFVTAAERIELITHPSRVGYRGAHRPRGNVDLVVDGKFAGSDELRGGDLLEVDLQTGHTAFIPGEAHTSAFSGLSKSHKTVELWLPHNEQLELISLRTDAPIFAAEGTERIWLHYGSSISQGSNASTPTKTWPAVVALQAGVNLHSLGLAGSALVDPFAARVMRDAPADLISVKLGINVVNFDSMRLRSFVPAVHGFLDTIRDGHPDTPVVLISPIFCGIHEETPGPGAIDPTSIGSDQVKFIATGTPDDAGRLTLTMIREALTSLAARRASDPQLYFLDGLQLFNQADALENPLSDALHPDSAAHRIIGRRFADYAFAPGGPFAAAHEVHS